MHSAPSSTISTRSCASVPTPVKRALPLVEAISRDLNETLLKVLASQRIMWQEFHGSGRRFRRRPKCSRCGRADEGLCQHRQRGDAQAIKKFLPIKINPAHAKLRERLNYIGAFRKTHEQLRAMVSSGKGLTMPGIVHAGTAASSNDRQVATQNLAGIEMSEEIRAAYDQVKVIDVLDVSQEGTEIWTTAEGAYNERVARVENSLIARLRDLLGQAKSAREMLRVLSQFNSLFVRPKVRGAVQEYQQQLLNSVKSDIKALHDKFKAQYRPSEANHMSQLRDVPEIAGAIIWARQIERQLNVYMKRVEDVLGKGWELYAEGQKLQSESETFRRKLDTRPLFDSWLHDINRRDMSIAGRVFDVTKNRAAGNAFQSVSTLTAIPSRCSKRCAISSGSISRFRTPSPTWRKTPKRSTRMPYRSWRPSAPTTRRVGWCALTRRSPASSPKFTPMRTSSSRRV